MKLANIRILAENTDLDPKFAECVNKVALARPELVFTFDARTLAHQQSRYSVDSTGQGHPRNGYYARQVEVTQDDLAVGSLTIERKAGGSGIDWHICVASRAVTINKHRRSSRCQNKTYSSNIVTAVRNAKKFLVKPALNLHVYEQVTRTSTEYGYALTKLEQDIARGRFIGDQAEMQLLLNAYLRGQEPDAQLASSYRATVMNPQYELALSEYLLAQHMRHHPNGVIPIHLMPNGLYAFFSGSELPDSRENAGMSTVHFLPFEELPDLWQDRLAVLQILSDKELVIDVGYRLSKSDFLLIR